MCLGIPAKIINLDGDYADADIDGATIRIGLQLLENVRKGDYVLVHTGYALEKLSEKDALETLELIRRLEEMDPEKPDTPA
jgi:hydrogenase expression/formation protein HypC